VCESASLAGHQPGLKFRGYQFKLADRPEELDQVHRLVFRTFVLEIKQHPDPGGGRLIDKFHHKNRYLMAERGPTWLFCCGWQFGMTVRIPYLLRCEKTSDCKPD
jgi:hypothetical protein